MKPTIKEEALDKPMVKRPRTAPSSLILLLATSHLRRTTTPRIRKAATRREAAWHPTSFEHASAMKFLNPIWRKTVKKMQLPLVQCAGLHSLARQLSFKMQILEPTSCNCELIQEYDNKALSSVQKLETQL